ncbi:MAG: MFS transporter [Chloroflexota bacterium]
MKSQRYVWPFAFYFTASAAAAVYSPYIVLYYQSLSLTGAQIGLLVGVAPLITIVSLPFLAQLADRTKQHRLIISLFLLILVGGLILFPFLRTFALLFLFSILLRVLLSPVFPFANSAAMVMLGDKKELFGRVRLGGTLGFSITAVIAGTLVESYGFKLAFWGAAAIYLVTFFINQKLVYSEASQVASPEKAPIRELLTSPHYLVLLLIGFAGGISFSSNNTYLFPYLKDLGAEASLMGFALTIGTLAEVPVLFFAGRFIRRFKAYGVLLFAMLMIALRFLLFAVAATPTVALFIQLLHGLTHPLLAVAGVNYADEQAPTGFKATAQGLFNTALGGIGAAFGGFAGGLLLDAFGTKGMYLAFGLFVLLVLLIVIVVKRFLLSNI